MVCFSYNWLSKNFRLSIASSVDSNQSYPSESLSCKQEEERSRLSRGPHFLNLRSLRTHWSILWAGSRGVSRLYKKCVTKALSFLFFLGTRAETRTTGTKRTMEPSFVILCLTCFIFCLCIFGKFSIRPRHTYTTGTTLLFYGVSWSLGLLLSK